MYTTKLDKNSEFYKKNELRAAELASEIMKVRHFQLYFNQDDLILQLFRNQVQMFMLHLTEALI